MTNKPVFDTSGEVKAFVPAPADDLVTEEMIETAAVALMRSHQPQWYWEEVPESERDLWRGKAQMLRPVLAAVARTFVAAEREAIAQALLRNALTYGARAEAASGHDPLQAMACQSVYDALKEEAAAIRARGET
jgi:hypothetical protein